MKIVFEFDSDEDRDDVRIHMSARTMHYVLTEYDGWLRNRIKYESRHELQEARDKLYEFLNAHEIASLMEL